MEKSVASMPFWKEYPERDTEFVRLYPTLYGPLSEEEIWTKDQMGFYVHIPFCNNVCISCPYKKLFPRGEITGRYVEALKAEISNYAKRPYVQDHGFSVGFFGGGTPTSLEDDQFVDLLQHISREFNLRDDIEISTETTPLDLSESKAEKILKNGISRISIGVQSFQDDELDYIGRKYTREKAIKTIEMLKRMGVNRLNIDLMYGLPGQTMESWDESLQIGMDLGLNSISFYRYILIGGPATTIKEMKGKLPALPSEEIIDQQFFHATEKLTKAGFEGYFADEFSKPGHKSSYIIKPWGEHLNILGLGACSLGSVKSHWYLNEPKIEKYIEKVMSGKLPITMGAKITKEDDLRRTMILGVKTGRVVRKEYIDSYGIDFVMLFADIIKQLEEQGLVKLTDEALEVIGPKGWYYLDNISKAFYDERYKRYPQPINSDISRWLKK